MSYEVSKPFNGDYRTWSIGDACQEGDDIGPHTIEDLVERGFLAPSKAMAALPAPETVRPNVAHAATINGSE